MNRKTLAIAVALLSTSMAHAACYSVYKADGTLLHESSTTPVNLALPIGDTVPEKFGPGATMTMSEHGFFCRDLKGEAQSGAKSLADAVRAEGEKAALMVLKQPVGGEGEERKTAAR
jgi:hypothetical protein